MSNSIDNCKLYFYLRNKAFIESEPDRVSSEPEFPTCSFGRDRSELGEVGMSRQQSWDALEQLHLCELVRKLTPNEEKNWETYHPYPHGDVYCIHAVDDLTAAMIIMSRS